jgi:uncharacterized protein (TIGR04141 family)
MSAEKIQIGIYKIDSFNDAFIDVEPIEKLSSIIENADYSRQNLMNNYVDGYQLGLYYKNNFSTPKWKSFMKSLSKRGEAILANSKSKVESFILLLNNKVTKRIYTVTGGHGYFEIQDYIDENFGMDVISRLIQKEDKILKSTREISVVGGVLGTTKHFRKNYNLFENDSFGKIYQELQANLNKEVLTSEFGFTDREVESGSVCIAKSSFRITKSITFSQLINIINGCESVIDNNEAILINNVERIVKKKNVELIESLDEQLLRQMWQRYDGGDDYRIDFDLCHKDFEKYLTASDYVIKKNSSDKNFFGTFRFEKELDSIDILFNKIKELESAPKNFDEFKKLITALKIYSYDQESSELTKGWLINHILGDVRISKDDKRYFYINKVWYLINDEFINELNRNCKQFIEKNKVNVLDKKWDTAEEDGYNESFLGDKDTLVLHKITSDNIEPCDVLKWNGDRLYLIHVKVGYNNAMRDLCSQVSIAANRIVYDRSAVDGKYINGIYDQLLASKASSSPYLKAIGGQTDKISKEEFVNLFKKDLVFVVAVLDDATSERELGSQDSFGSNIAKFSLQELIKEFGGSEADLKIEQIYK